MKKLNPPNINAEQAYKTIKERSRSEDKKQRLENLESYIFDRYSDYLCSVEILESITSSRITEDEDKNALQSCYSRNSKGYLEGEVVANIIGIQSIQHKQKCPYCGLDKPRTIDHYLPKSIFPEFSIFPPNLIPCCGYCNSKKNDTWLKDGERNYLNLYYDDIPEGIEFLYTRLIYIDDSLVPLISFTLENNFGINQGLFKLIERHYENLNLLNEYSESIEEEFSSIIDKIENYPILSIDEHKQSIERDYRTIVRKYGVNFWKASFLKGLLNCDEFFKRVRNLEVGVGSR